MCDGDVEALRPEGHVHVVAFTKRLIWREEGRQGRGRLVGDGIVYIYACGLATAACRLLRRRAAGLGTGMTPLRSDEAMRL